MSMDYVILRFGGCPFSVSGGPIESTMRLFGAEENRGPPPSCLYDADARSGVVIRTTSTGDLKAEIEEPPYQ